MFKVKDFKIVSLIRFNRVDKSIYMHMFLLYDRGCQR